MTDMVGYIVAYEQGNLTDSETVLLFAHLIETGMAWTLQGHYGRTAQAFIDADIITPDGEVDWTVLTELVVES